MYVLGWLYVLWYTPFLWLLNPIHVVYIENAPSTCKSYCTVFTVGKSRGFNTCRTYAYVCIAVCIGLPGKYTFPK